MRGESFLLFCRRRAKVYTAVVSAVSFFAINGVKTSKNQTRLMRFELLILVTLNFQLDIAIVLFANRNSLLKKSDIFEVW